jgi:hypothetical protein
MTQTDKQRIENKILKAVLLLRTFNTYDTKEEQREEARTWYNTENEATLDGWIMSLQEEVAKTPEEREREAEAFWEAMDRAEAEELYEATHGESPRYTSCYAGDYGPSNPWDAPGMSIHDFI